jgi:ribonuclease P protein component
VSEPSPPTSPRAAPALASARLKRRGEFLRVAARGKRAARPGLVLQAMPAAASTAGSGAPPPRLGFTVTRKVGGAVVRNRIRRRLKEAARLTFREHPEAARGWDLVLIGREGTAQRRFQDLRADLEGALRQLGAWSGAPPTAGGARPRRGAANLAAGRAPAAPEVPGP